MTEEEKKMDEETFDTYMEDVINIEGKVVDLEKIVELHKKALEEKYKEGYGWSR